MSNELEAAYQYCENVTKTHAKSFYFAAKFLPETKRRAVYPIYAFCRHVDDAVDEAENASREKVIETVHVWQAILDEIYQKSTIEISKTKEQSFVSTAWRELVKTYEIPEKLPRELVEGVLMDTRIKRYETFGELYIYCYRVASTVGLMSSEILGFSDRIALDYAEAMGIAMQLTNILRDIKEDALMNRIYLPQEDLRKFNVSEEQIFANQIDENFVELMRFQIKRARDFYAKGEQGIRLLEKDSRFTVLLAARIYGKILDEIERQNYDVFARRAHRTFSQKIFSIPKIWRDAKRLK